MTAAPVIFVKRAGFSSVSATLEIAPFQAVIGPWSHPGMCPAKSNGMTI